MMLAEVEEIIEEQEAEKMPSFNHSYICREVLKQLFQDEKLDALPELTLDIENGIIPDISVYSREEVKPDFFRDYSKYPEIPVLAIEVISASQNIQTLLEKAEMLVKNGVKAVWTIEPFSRTVFVTTEKGEEIFHNQEIESEGIKVDFRKIFEGNAD